MECYHRLIKPYKRLFSASKGKFTWGMITLGRLIMGLAIGDFDIDALEVLHSLALLESVVWMEFRMLSKENLEKRLMSQLLLFNSIPTATETNLLLTWMILLLKRLLITIRNWLKEALVLLLGLPLHLQDNLLKLTSVQHWLQPHPHY